MSFNPFKNSILVPIDYSPESENAILHAVVLSKKSNMPIVLLHIVKELELSRRTKTLIEDEHQKLAVLAEKLIKPEQIKVATIVRFGDFSEIIGHTANEFQMSMVVMATHGVKGMQYIKGSHALKIIENARVPFTVVQGKKPNPNGFQRVVFPIDNESATKQKLVLVPQLNKLFNSTFHLLVEHNNDEFFDNIVKANLAFIQNYLKENNVKYELNYIDVSSNLSDATIAYANEIDADLIMIMVETSRTLLEIFTGKDEQEIITNKFGIPVMCMNPTEIGNYVISSTFS
jgi:nucleotide-binding universal stress UspA family protein